MGFGGPVWHASVRTYGGNMALAKEQALRALEGVGDATLGEWHEQGATAYHVRRRLSAAECEQTGLVMRDIRGTPEERQRMATVFREVPQLQALTRLSERRGE
jgi:hypothetical protein